MNTHAKSLLLGRNLVRELVGIGELLHTYHDDQDGPPRAEDVEHFGRSGWGVNLLYRMQEVQSHEVRLNGLTPEYCTFNEHRSFEFDGGESFVSAPHEGSHTLRLVSIRFACFSTRHDIWFGALSGPDYDSTYVWWWFSKVKEYPIFGDCKPTTKKMTLL